MRKYLLILVISFIFLQQGNSQKIDIGFNVGYGFYQLDDLKQYQLEKRDEFSNINVKAVEQFPANYYYSLFANIFANKRNIVGFSGAYHTTGGRNHIKDPTGEYKLDMILSGYRIGLNYQNIVFPYKRLRVTLKIEVGMISNNLSLDE